RRVGRLDPAGSATRMLREVRRALTREHGIPASRIRLVNGGHRRLRQVELWVVPRGAHAPIATPDAFPKKRAGR
ncbi:MAG TPA: hypothetical protein VFX96_19050, partial [Pyrinomonadaceae bacterium]|nr:hypothetical protein [Pyrinomonadaceae bacterium]